MKVRLALALPVAILLASALANAANPCGPVPLTVVDGRIGGPITVSSGTDVSVVFWVTQAHSYSAEVTSTDDNAMALTTLIVGGNIVRRATP